jgi:hypothetical protein
MSQISDVVKIPKGLFVYCTSTSANFMGATSINFFDGNKSFAPKKFKVGEKTQCFSRENPVAPVIKLEEDVPANFLQRGNEVVFGF